jgi:hypothetical protein
MLAQTQVGPSIQSNGTQAALRGGKLGDGIFSELHGRFYEQNYQGNVYAGGLNTLTSLANANFTTGNGLSGTLATAAGSTPIMALWNPSSSTINAVILQAILAGVITASTVTGLGGLIWCAFLSNPNITVASQQVPVNMKTLATSGSQCKCLNGLALTGLSNIGVAIRNSSLFAGPGTNYSQVGTAVGFPTTSSGPSIENIDGSLIVPPGGILALYSLTQGVAISAIGSLVWEEVPV